ncbi:MAG: hypothetical protein K2M15_01315, partial [Oscillospiraceae bacterium]|nr:hypothetical protein [Oscillospiraceae bacterium]
MSPAGANKPGAEVQATAHTHNWVWKYSYNGGYAISSSGCAAITYHKWECACGATYDSRVTEAEKPHSGGKRYSATCNGNIQTWYYTSCSRCSTSYTTTCVCPGKGHQGPCPC